MPSKKRVKIPDAAPGYLDRAAFSELCRRVVPRVDTARITNLWNRLCITATGRLFVPISPVEVICRICSRPLREACMTGRQHSPYRPNDFAVNKASLVTHAESLIQGSTMSPGERLLLRAIAAS